MKIKSLLIANRGEIAMRILRACHELGIATVAVYSDADARMPFVAEADEAVRLGPAPSSESYLRIDKILEAAARTGSDAIHPGYGFLAENAAFADACAEAGVTFIGPTADAIRAMGSKSTAKEIVFYCAYGERLNLRVIEAFHSAGIRFAVPSQRLLLASDPDDRGGSSMYALDAHRALFLAALFLARLLGSNLGQSRSLQPGPGG